MPSVGGQQIVPVGGGQIVPAGNVAGSVDVDNAKTFLSSLVAAMANAYAAEQVPVVAYLKDESTWKAAITSIVELIAEAPSAPNWTENVQAALVTARDNLQTSVVAGQRLKDAAMTVLDPNTGLSALGISQQAPVIAGLLDELVQRRAEVVALQAQLKGAGLVPGGAPGAAQGATPTTPKTVTTGQAVAVGVGGIALGVLATKLLAAAI